MYVKNGKCAYELATWNGFDGSLSVWLKSISNNCESQVFEVVNQNDYKGTFYDWLQFFVNGNEQNSSPYYMLKKLGYNGSIQDLFVVLSNEKIEGVLDFIATKGCEINKDKLITILIGSSKDYGFSLAKEHGFRGNEKEWIAVINSKKKVKDTDIKRVYINKDKHLIFVFDNNEEKDIGLVDVSNPADLKVVKFTDNDGKVIKTEIVKIGDSVSAPEAPQKNGSVFIGWDKQTDDIKADITVRPQYEKITSPTISVESITVEPGEKDALMSISIINNPGILGMTLNCLYDQNIINVSNAENGAALKNVLSFTKPLHFDTKSKYSWDGQEISTEQVKDGEILKLYISVPENAVPGVYPVTISSAKGDIIDNDLSPIDVKIINGTVTVK